MFVISQLLMQSSVADLYFSYYLVPNVSWGSWLFFFPYIFHDLYKYFCCCIVFYFYPLHFIGTKLLVHFQGSHANIPIYSMIIY